MTKKSNATRVIVCLICGLFVGFLNGFFGGGGGMIVVPLLIFVLSLEEKKAHATAILTILPIPYALNLINTLKTVPRHMLQRNLTFIERTAVNTMSTEVWLS